MEANKRRMEGQGHRGRAESGKWKENEREIKGKWKPKATEEGLRQASGRKMKRK